MSAVADWYEGKVFLRAPIDAMQPGRYILEVAEDGLWHAMRLQEGDGDPKSALRFPEVNAYLDRYHRKLAAVKAALRETE